MMNDFFKDNRRVSSQIVRRMANENSNALSLWLGLKDIANGYGICVASYKALSGLIGDKSRMTTYRAIKYLYSNGFIGIGKIGSQNAYILNPNIVQKLAGDTTKYALANHGITFVGEIHLTQEENPKLYKDTEDFLKENPVVNGKYSIKHLKHFKSVHDSKSSHHHAKSKRSMQNKADNKSAKQHRTAKQTELINKKYGKARYSSLYAKNNAKKAHRFQGKNKRVSK